MERFEKIAKPQDAGQSTADSTSTGATTGSAGSGGDSNGSDKSSAGANGIGESGSGGSEEGSDKGNGFSADGSQQKAEVAGSESFRLQKSSLFCLFAGWKL